MYFPNKKDKVNLPCLLINSKYFSCSDMYIREAPQLRVKTKISGSTASLKQQLGYPSLQVVEK